MTNKIFYKNRLVAEAEGLLVVTDKLVSIHETRCYHFCIPESEMRWVEPMKRIKESVLQYARRFKILRRIDKSGSRIAFKTPDEAMENLRFLKEKQLYHLAREQAFIEKFLSTERFDGHRVGLLIPESKDLVNEYLNFEDY